ncbi:4'-phosphopantetheinyl transferase superfamily protein [Reyranella sp. CPCC 100927]|uniref:4'-phosphopantetheinyl transferase family protein n=1 Tax=Reyranella sp. CPCC 100927 TaxID=2599616 RepID=UPI001C49A170|nr:4'-phosphopantetheinyl transferase superfamily protein [Reyranella sp. CPCC 100927]
MIRQFGEEAAPSLEIDSRGKPSIQPSDGTRPPAVSITHTIDMVSAAACDWGPVGIDLEMHDRRRDIARLAAFAFGPSEQAMVRTGGAAAFYRIWTLREAMGKATGDGLSLATDGMDRIQPAPFEGAWRSPDEAWQFAHCLIRPDVSFAMAIQAPPGTRPDSWSLNSITWWANDATSIEQ